MVKIIGEDKKKKKRITCNNCASKLEYTLSEVVVLWSGTDYGGGPDGATGFKCPKCEKNVIIERW